MTPADAVPIVLVHGTRFSAAQWSVQLAALRDEFWVVAVDLPGHGKRWTQPWSLAGATEIIASAVDSLDRGPALVVGHSLGGYASLEFARRRPESLRGLILAGASASTRGLRAVPYRWVAQLVPHLSAERLTRWNDRLLRRLYPPDVVDATIRAHPCARVELIPRAGHLANFDDPDAFTDAVRHFARQLPAVD
ncbi:alpha/beta hydrolase [Streptomyces sp. NPDC002553]|uniref:alpha/beta fold hydrolase n=1 Tax=Streptomyces sp. NPDC002553 TaxID=3154417 RepID=UPI00332AC8B7